MIYKPDEINCTQPLKRVSIVWLQDYRLNSNQFVLLLVEKALYPVVLSPEDM